MALSAVCIHDAECVSRMVVSGISPVWGWLTDNVRDHPLGEGRPGGQLWKFLTCTRHNVSVV